MPDVEFWGAFFDTTYAYRFGPPSHDVTIATLATASGDLLAEAFHFPLGRAALPPPKPLNVAVEQDDQGWLIRLSTSSFAQSVRIEDAAFRPEHNWFHLVPGYEKVVRMTPRKGCDASMPGGLAGSVFGNSAAYGAAR
jgi:beta-mannosidase